MNAIFQKNVRFVLNELYESDKLADIISDRDIDVFSGLGQINYL